MDIHRVRTGLWAGDCFVYTNANNRLNYSVGGETFTIAHLDRVMYLLGYMPGQSRLYLVDKVTFLFLMTCATTFRFPSFSLYYVH